MPDTDVVLYEEKGGIARITLNRPEFHNALNREMLQSLSSLFNSIKTNPEVKGVIITGAGENAFSAGADIRFLNQASSLEVRELALLAVSVYHQIEVSGKIVIAALNGYALGGGLELAEACTLRVSARHALFGHPEVKIGAIAGWGGVARLPRIVGRGHATEILLTGRLVPAEEALRIGLVNRVVEGETLLTESEGLLREILSQAPLSTKFTWEAIQRGLNLTLEEATLLGADYFGIIASSEDFREGTKAFLEKAKPAFKGR